MLRKFRITLGLGSHTDSDHSAGFSSGVVRELRSLKRTVPREKRGGKMVDSLSEDQQTQYREIFYLLDSKGDRKIGSDQVGDALRAFGLNPTESDIKQMTNELGTKRVDFEEFLPVYLSLSHKKEYESLGDFTDGLKVLDKDGTGVIDAAELRHVLSSLGDKMTEEEIDAVLEGLENDQGQINYEDFVKRALSG